MQNDRTVFRNRIETKGLLVAYAVVFAPLFLLITISDTLNKSPHLWRNLLSLTFGLLVLLFPVGIIARFQIVFDGTLIWHNCKKSQRFPLPERTVGFF